MFVAMTQPARAYIRLAELLGVLSFGADLGGSCPILPAEETTGLV
jgi:hypothetical protein